MFLDNRLALIKEYIPSVPPELAFNVSESGFIASEEHKAKSVRVPRRVKDSTCHYTVNQVTHHQILICCMTAVGDAYSLF
jgi:hypothetical protein